MGIYVYYRFYVYTPWDSNMNMQDIEEVTVCNPDQVLLALQLRVEVDYLTEFGSMTNTFPVCDYDSVVFKAHRFIDFMISQGAHSYTDSVAHEHMLKKAAAAREQMAPLVTWEPSGGSTLSYAERRDFFHAQYAADVEPPLIANSV